MRGGGGEWHTYLGSVILIISLASLPIKLTLSSTGAYLGIGMAVDW